MSVLQCCPKRTQLSKGAQWEFDNPVSDSLTVLILQNIPISSVAELQAAQAQGSAPIWGGNLPFPGGCTRDSLGATRDWFEGSSLSGFSGKERTLVCLFTDAAGTQPAWPSSRLLGWVSPLSFSQTMVHTLSSSSSSETWGNPTGKRAGRGLGSYGEERSAVLPAAGTGAAGCWARKKNCAWFWSALGISWAEQEHCFSLLLGNGKCCSGLWNCRRAVVGSANPLGFCKKKSHTETPNLTNWRHLGTAGQPIFSSAADPWPSWIRHLPRVPASLCSLRASWNSPAEMRNTNLQPIVTSNKLVLGCPGWFKAKPGSQHLQCPNPPPLPFLHPSLKTFT